MNIDQSVYPDLDHPPDQFLHDPAKANYLHRICTAWDFGIMPEPATFTLFSHWQDIFNRFPVLTSPAYHAFRSHFAWPERPWPSGIHPPTPRWQTQDQLEGRHVDPCEELI